MDYETVRKWLEMYGETEKDIANQVERLERLVSRMESVSSPTLSDMPKSPSFDGDKIGKMLSEKEELEKYIEEKTGFLEAHRNNIEYMLRPIKNPDDKAVIRMRYIDGESGGDIISTLYGNNDDFEEKFGSYSRRMYKHMQRAITLISKAAEDNEILEKIIVDSLGE